MNNCNDFYLFIQQNELIFNIKQICMNYQTILNWWEIAFKIIKKFKHMSGFGKRK